MITNNEEIKIIDFGLSNIYSPRRLLNTFCGSLYFAAPELLQARNYTGPEVDIWSFGVVLYVLVCGRVPFDDTSLPALHQKIKAGYVEYPDHLSKGLYTIILFLTSILLTCYITDCVNLLSKILVVDPLKRETLSFVIHHPWMNKGFDEPIFNHLPHRQPLTSIDPQVVQGMQGFELGSPDEIETKLLHIISSPEYQYAAAQVDQNYIQKQQRHQQKQHQQQQQQLQQPENTQSENLSSRFRRKISIRRTSPSNATKKDDPQSLPAMYDPLISIYSLVKERRELDEKIQLLASGGYMSPVQLGRSASTSLTKSSAVRNNQQSNLIRRKTERVPPSHTRNMFKDDTAQQADWAAPTATYHPPGRSNSVRSTTNILQRSKSAAKRLGAMWGQQVPSTEDQSGDTVTSIERKSSDGLQCNNLTEPPDLSYSTSLKKKTIHLLRSSSLTDRRYREQKKPSSSPTSSAANSSIVDEEVVLAMPAKYGSSAPTSNYSGGRFIEEGNHKAPSIDFHILTYYH